MNSKGNSALDFNRIVSKSRLSRGLLFGVLILGALLAFEIFNYSTTEFALTDLMGNLKFAGIGWAAILAIAFCGIDFAGIARLFTPERGVGEQREVWYLFGAWMLAATMNAMLTYWGVSIAILNHNSMGSAVISQQKLIQVVPVFVAIMVWLIRVLIIGTFSVAGNRLFSQSNVRQSSPQPARPGQPSPLPTPLVVPNQSASFKPAPKAEPQSAHVGYPRPEPTYHPASMSSSAPSQLQLHK